jgi:hypothetical protein
MEGASAPLSVTPLDSCTSYAAPHINPDEELPVLTPPDSEAAKDPRHLTSMGNIAIKNGDFVFMDNALPKSYQNALAYSLAEPLTGCMVARHTTEGINIFQWGKDENAYVQATSVHDINMFLTHDPTKERAFTTPEATRRTITHESAHTFLTRGYKSH